MVGSFDSASAELSLISIPRDTYITLSDNTVSTLGSLNTSLLPRHSVRNNAPRINQGNYSMRINAIYHHFGEVYGVPYTIKQVEEMLGIRVDYYVVVKLDGFVKIVDAVGGIVFNVPQRMYWVHDPDEFGISFSIDLHPGVQKLNGKQALDMVRYRASSDETIARGYARADLQRVELQQDFMREAIVQLMNTGTIISNFTAYVGAVADNVDTNFAVGDAMRYFSYAREMNADKITTYTLPIINPAPAGFPSGTVALDPIPTLELVQRIFYGIEEDGADD
jgi:LCP family protein required for cell wall assembly